MMGRALSIFNMFKREVVTSLHSQMKQSNSYASFLVFFCFSGQPFLTFSPSEKREQGFTFQQWTEKSPELLSNQSSSACMYPWDSGS